MPAKKKTTKRRVKKAPTKKVSKKVKAKKAPVKKKAVKRPIKGVPPIKKRVRIVVKNLILFAILFVLSVALGMVNTSEIWDQLFWILAILTGFIAAAFLIILLIFVFMGSFNRK